MKNSHTMIPVTKELREMLRCLSKKKGETYDTIIRRLIEEGKR